MNDAYLNPEMEKLLKKAVEGISKFFGLSEVGLRNIAKYGWYINGSLSMGYTTNLMERAIEGDGEFLDIFFTNYYRKELEKLAELVSKREDSRTHIIKEAIECHKEKRYYASTILFLSQADGICNGVLFTTRKEKQALKKFIDKSEYGSFFKLLFGMITNENAVDTGYANTENYENTLNRHRVVHGRDLKYGTEINSLKAFSLLSFVADFVNRYK